MSKLDCFGNEQSIHEMLDFFIIGSKRQQGYFYGHKSIFPRFRHDIKKRITITKPRKIGVMEFVQTIIGHENNQVYKIS
jgi:hypothetical protein